MPSRSVTESVRDVIERLRRRVRGPRPPRDGRALVLVGGGVIGGMYEVGVLAALEEAVPGFQANAFDVYVGSSAGSVVAGLMANGVPPRELYTILDEGRDDPLNFQRGAIFHRGASAAAAWNFAQLIWSVSKSALTSLRLDWPEVLARSQDGMPAGFYTVGKLEEYLRQAFEAKGLSNDFRTCPRLLLVPAVDLDRSERVVFGMGEHASVPISQAIAASSSIPGFFAPFTIGGRDYVDGDVGHTGHADLAVGAGARAVVVVNPLVPLRTAEAGAPAMRRFGLYGILEQVGRINSQNLLEAALRELHLRRPEVRWHLIQPTSPGTPLFGPSMGFDASRAALRFGYTSTLEWLDGGGTPLREEFARG